MAFDKPVVVIDNGGYMTKAGFACDNHPVSMFRTVVGRPDHLNGSFGREHYDVFIGDDAMNRIDGLELSCPVKKGRIVHWDNIERIWHHTFYKELKAAPEDRAVLLASSVTSPMEEKIKCCEVLFETLNIPALCIQPQAVLALYGFGLTTGLSLDLGYDTTDICPVYEGGIIKYAHMQTNYASVDISNIFRNRLVECNLDFGRYTSNVIKHMKRNMYVTENRAMSLRGHERIYHLPNGDEIDVGNEAFLAAEMFFSPNLITGYKSDVLSLQEAVAIAGLKCDAELRSELYESIVSCGGLAMIPGLGERLSAEVEEIVQIPVNVLSSSEAYAASWLGGAIFASMSDSQKLWVSKSQYEDFGHKIVLNKFM